MTVAGLPAFAADGVYLPAGIPILEGPYAFGDTRAVLMEDLDGLAIELIEAGS